MAVLGMGISNNEYCLMGIKKRKSWAKFYKN